MKLLMLGAAMLAATFSQAQTEAPKPAAPELRPAIMIKAGFNRSNFGVQNGPRLNERRALNSWHAGVAADLPLNSWLSVQPALIASAKGAKFVVGEPRSENYTDVRTNPVYLELPVNVVAKYAISGNVKVFAGAGAYAAYAIAGKVKTEGRELGNSFKKDESIKFTNDAPSYIGIGNPYQTNLKRFDFGMNLVAGVELDRFSVSLNYGHGFANIRPEAAGSKERYQNRVMSVSMGIRL